MILDKVGKVTKICGFGYSLIFGCDCYTGPEEQDGAMQWDSPSSLKITSGPLPRISGPLDASF
jgi:hypothetical protein